MKATVKIEQEIDISVIEISVAVRYDNEDIPYDFPLRHGDLWKARVGIDTGIIENWPLGESGSLYMKVCDMGVYRLFDASGKQVAEIDGYVPHGVVPGEYGDYIDLKISESGEITNWHVTGFEDFFPED